MTPKKILVPTDFSPSSRLALESAMTLATAFQSRVHVFNAWEVPPYLRPDLTVWVGDVSTTLTAHARGEAEKAMREFLADAKVGENANVTSQIVNGAPYATILAMAKEGNFDLIAMGTHGRTGVAHLVLGSVAERIVRHSPCAVLTVRGT
jgi:nucleotide-binding universal stress UspA family protein